MVDNKMGAKKIISARIIMCGCHIAGYPVIRHLLEQGIPISHFLILSPEQGEILVGLATRSLLSDAKEARTPTLISLLEDKNIIFRRYAIQWLRELYTESPIDMARYRADWAEKQLVEGAAWWRKRYDQGLLIPRTP